MRPDGDAGAQAGPLQLVLLREVDPGWYLMDLDGLLKLGSLDHQTHRLALRLAQQAAIHELASVGRLQGSLLGLIRAARMGHHTLALLSAGQLAWRVSAVPLRLAVSRVVDGTLLQFRHLGTERSRTDLAGLFQQGSLQPCMSLA